MTEECLIWRILGLGGVLALSCQISALAQNVLTTEAAEVPGALARPEIQSQRWEEDWCALANPSLRTDPLDVLKYIPLTTDGSACLSFGANVRQRVEAFDAPQYGTSHQAPNTYLLDRVELNADLRVDGWQAFIELADDEAPGKTIVTPADADRLDLEEGFIAHVGPLGDGTLKVRLGRQEFAFDLQRFVSNRDGANVRQAYDAVWGDYELPYWRIISFVSEPVQYANNTVFDDYSDRNLLLGGFRVERRDVGPGNLAVYYLRFQHEDAHFIEASGYEIRNCFDVHYSGVAGPIDFDAETMVQEGSIGGRAVRAWAFGERSGYTFKMAPWSPNLSIQFDAASGNRSSSTSGTFGTFNPLFPNEWYFSLSGLTTYANLVHIKPILSITPEPSLLLQAAVGFQWRQTTNDAIYTVPVVPVANTAGHGSLWTASYVQFDVAKQVNANVTLYAEATQYEVGSTIRRAGGHNTTYASFQVSLAW